MSRVGDSTHGIEAEQLNCNCTATGFARGPGREERDKHDQDQRVEGREQREEEREKRAETREKRS